MCEIQLGKELEGFEEKMVDTKNRLDMQKVQELGGTHSLIVALEVLSLERKLLRPLHCPQYLHKTSLPPPP